MLDKRLLWQGWTEQKWMETNRLIEKSYEEFVARLKRAYPPPGRSYSVEDFSPGHSLSDWDQNPAAQLDTTKYISPPSSALQTFTGSGTLNWGGMLLKGFNASQGQMIVWFYGSCNYANNQAVNIGWYFRQQNSGFNVANGYAYMIALECLGIMPFGLYLNQSQIQSGTNYLGYIEGMWLQYALTFWSDPTLGLIVRAQRTDSSPVETNPDFIDPTNAYAGSTTNRVGMWAAFMNFSQIWWDNFQLYTP